ncbi:MAG: DUF3617 family protein [Halieaceae bacterium]|jgi:hypothetical protein|nr:DUF3617 family protein [Halieaceae bacterium]
MTIKSVAVSALSLALATAAHAVEPNINPGMWETTSTITLKSAQFSMPARTETNSECLTSEQVAEGQAFLEQDGDCTFAKKDLRADGMDYAMTCKTPEGGTVDLNASMQFKGESMTGTIDGTMGTPMGEMTMNIVLSGQRKGGC